MKHLALILTAIVVLFNTQMANLENKLTQIGSQVVYTQANVYFQAMLNAMAESGIDKPTLHSSYMSKYEVADDLRARLKDEFKTAAPPTVPFEGNVGEDLGSLLDVSRTIIDVASQAADYDKLESYLNSCATSSPDAFDPPIKLPFNTEDGTQVYPIPSSTNLDARRFARVFYFDTPFTSSQKKWLINNSPLYGFVLYEDYALYYIGFTQIKAEALNGVEKLVNRFQQKAISPSEIQVTSAAIQAAVDPAQPITEKTPNGTMYFTSASNPFIFVIGGIDVNGEKSGKYMPKYFDPVFQKYNIWIADSNKSPGKASYDEAMLYLSQKGWSSSTKILYLFSGGYSQGYKLVTSGDINTFTKVLIVDIWMKNDNRWPTWVKNNVNKASYFYSSSGPGGGLPAGAEQQNSILSSLGYPTPRTADTIHFINNHMKTNDKAVATL